jgi:hypothetical protein
LTRVGGAEHVLALLRARLQRMQRSRRKNAKPTQGETRLTGSARLQQIAEAGGADDDVEHAVLAAILQDEFGDAIANEPKFQETIGEVLAVLRRDEHGRVLLQRTLADLRAR